MMAHEDQISDTCYVTILDVADGIELALSNIWRAVEVCEADVDKFCTKVATNCLKLVHQGRIIDVVKCSCRKKYTVYRKDKS